MSGMSFDKCFREIWGKYTGDEKVYEMLKRVGPAFPIPGPHYNYADLIEHIRWSLLHLCTCNPDELPEYHLPEIYKRVKMLYEEVSQLVRGGFIREEEHQHFRDHIYEITREWEKDFKKYFSQCVGG